MTQHLVVGTDGIAPIYDEYGLWKTWAEDEIYLGGPGEGKYVPNVNNHVCRPATFETFIVDHLDPVTLIPTLRAIKPMTDNQDLTDEDIAFGVGPGRDNRTVLAYLNDSVFPHVLEVDKRYTIPGSMTSYCKIFLGTDTSQATGVVISKVYDATGNYLGDKVPLELVQSNSHDNHAIKCVRRCNVTRKFPDNERITVVFYSDDGYVVGRCQMLIENTDLISDINASTRYITNISLESNFLSPTIPDTLEFPLNIPMDSLNLMGVVHYTDGELRLPVDGGKFELIGMDSRVSAIPGQPIPLTLRYQLSRGETAYATSGVNGNKITKPFRLKTTNPNNSIAVKLFGYPHWQGEANGYVMKWWLLNLDRNLWFDATEHVRFNENFGAYDPKLYGYIQRRSVSVNLRDVSSTFIPFIHTQLVDIVLSSKPSTSTDSWQVATEAGDGNPKYGVGVYAKRLDANGTVSLKGDYTTYAQWLDAYYRKTLPLINEQLELAAPDPTHFIIRANGVDTKWAIGAWDQPLSIASMLTNFDTISIRFIKQLLSSELQLSVGAMLIRP